MPELPEVETVRRGLEPLILNKKIVRVKPEAGKCFQGEISDIEGAKVVGLRRFGKALVVDLDNGRSMMVHLRMTGQLIWRGGDLLSRSISSLNPASAQSSYVEYDSFRSSDLPRTKTEIAASRDVTTPLRASNSPRSSSPITAPQDDSFRSSDLPRTKTEIAASRDDLSRSSSPITAPQERITRDVLARTEAEMIETRDEQQDPAQADFAAGHPSKNFTAELPNSQTRVEFDFEDGKLFFNDQRKFGFVKILSTAEVEQDKFIASLGKEPWDMKPKELFEKCQRHGKAPIKAVLLDQKVIAGIGNIYADESLFYAGVHPETKAGLLSETEVAKILEGACKVMQASIDSGGSTMATYIKPDGTTGDYLELFAEVFRRNGQPCKRCGAEIIKTRVAGRGTHICPKCQKVRTGQEEATCNDVASSERIERGR